MVEIRILDILNTSGLSKQDFAIMLGISSSTLSHLSSGRNKASLDLVVTVLQNFPEINPEWLILGKGEMKRSDNEARLDKVKEKLIKEVSQISDDFENKIKKINTLIIEIKDL